VPQTCRVHRRVGETCQSASGRVTTKEVLVYHEVVYSVFHTHLSRIFLLGSAAASPLACCVARGGRMLDKKIFLVSPPTLTTKPSAPVTSTTCSKQACSVNEVTVMVSHIKHVSVGLPVTNWTIEIRDLIIPCQCTPSL